MERSDVGGVGGRGRGEGVEGEAGRGQVRASIRLSPEATEVWSRLDKASRVRLGALFNELIVWYGRTGRLPIAPISTILSASELLARGFEACREELSRAEGEVERLRGELQQLKQRLIAEEAYRQQVEALSRQLEEEKARVSQLERQVAQLRDSLKHKESQLDRLATTLCPHVDELKQLLAGDRRAEVEVEALCWRRR